MQNDRIKDQISDTIKDKMKKLRILVVDDDEDDFVLIKEYIKEGMRHGLEALDHVSTFPDAVEAIRGKAYDLLFFDYRLGEQDGIALMAQMRAEGVRSPIIFLTGQGDEDTAVAAMKAGATDYLPKANLNSELLCHSIKLAMELARSEEIRALTEQALLASEARYRDLVNRMPAIVCEITRQGGIVFINEAVFALTGYTPQELMGKTLWEKLLPPESKLKWESFYHVLQGGGVANYEVSIVGKDGFVRVLDWNGSARIDASGVLQSAVCIGTDITELVQLREKLRALSIVDELTGLNNRRGFYTLMEQQLKIAKRYRKEMLLVFLDLDGLKKINDTFGHKEGDRVLAGAAQVLSETFRESDIIGRTGGDEFVVLVTEISDLDDNLIKTRLQDNIMLWNEDAKLPYRLSMSTGIVRYDPASPVMMDELVAQADMLMYQDKERKRIKVDG